jgi:hypothetical protein
MIAAAFVLVETIVGIWGAEEQPPRRLRDEPASDARGHYEELIGTPGDQPMCIPPFTEKSAPVE